MAAASGGRMELDGEQRLLLTHAAPRLGNPFKDPRLGNQVVDHLAMNIRQTEVAPRVAIRESLVIDSHEVQDRGVQVVNVHASFH